MDFFRKLFSIDVKGQPVSAVSSNGPQPERLPRLHARRDRLRAAIKQEESSGTPDHVLAPLRRELAGIDKELTNG